MKKLSTCPYCSDSVSGEAVRLWDGRDYCRDCVENVSPELYAFVMAGGRLEDVVGKSDVHAMNYIVGFGKIYLGFMVCFIGLVYFFFALAGRAEMKDFLGAIAFFCVVGMVFIALKSVIGISFVRSNLPRTVSIIDNQLLIKTTQKEEGIPLSNCHWYPGSTLDDHFCFVTGLRKGIVILSPEKRIACGHSPEMLDHWCAFLKLAQVPRISPPQHLRLFVFGFLAIFFVILLTISIGYLLSLVADNSQIPVILFLGSGEVTLMVIMYAIFKFDNYESSKEAFRKVFRPALWGGVILPFGLFFGGLTGGLQGAYICGSCNAMIGALAAWFFRSQMKVKKPDFLE